MLHQVCKQRKMGDLKLFLVLGLSILLFVSAESKSAYAQQPQVKKAYNICDYGAVSDGKTLNTRSIQSAIDAAHESKQGGIVVFPKGQFLTGSIEMKSNVDLYFSEGAVLLGSTNPDDYIAIDSKGRPKSPKNDDMSELALILANKVNKIQLYGKGTIDGQGRELALKIDSLHHAGIKIDPNYSLQVMRPNERVRPKLFRFSQCNQVKIKDLNIQSSACWGLSFELCSNLIIDNVKLTNRAYWNNDGMDITDCRNVSITNCNVNSADDGICLKSYYPGYFNDSIYIANCTIRSSASAIKFGTASYGGFKNVTIEDIKIYDTFRSAIALESVDGGFIENINIRNIEAVNTGNAIFIRLGHRDGEQPGTIKNIHIKDINVQVPFGRPDIDYDIRGPEVNFFHNPLPSSIVGIPGHPVENVVLENIEISYPGRASKGMAYVPLSRLDQVPENIKNYPEFDMFRELPAWGFYVRHAKGLTFKNVKLTLDDEDFRPAFVFDDVDGINMKQVALPEPVKNQIYLYQSKNALIDDQYLSAKKHLFNASQKEFLYSGRTEKLNDTVQALISSAAHFVFNAKSDSVIFLLGCQGDPTAYVVIEVNGNYYKRFRVVKDSVNRIAIPLSSEKYNEIGVYKATEASNGPILFYGVEAASIAFADVKTTATIEFIGNSITCGFGADTREIPCGTGTWYDKHNAYLAYGPLAARQLNAAYNLSSVSGMGIYRNWNDEDTAPVMGDVYFTTRLNGNKDKMWDFSGCKPDLVSICLGTNDLSNGDGMKARKPFNPEKFTSNYIDFVKRLFEVYPDTKLALLTSPMVSAKNNEILLSCLQKVKAHFDDAHTVAIFKFKPMQPKGCDSHPDLKDHEVMAKQLLPFYAKLLLK